MPHREPDSLAIALRVYPEGADEEESSKSRRWPPRPSALMVIDTETRTDATQRLTFGSYRFIEGGECLREFLFYGDDLPNKDRRVLERYRVRHAAETSEYGVRRLDLLSRKELIEKIYGNAYKGRCLLVAFNFPFDISRIAFDFAYARRRYSGGFTLILSSYLDKTGQERADRYRPGVSIKQIDSKRALKAFTGRKETDKEDRIPEESRSGRPKKDYVFHGHFLDLRTLAFALTDRGYSLEQACEAFGVEHGKQRVRRHGIVTPKYIDYNRNDVLQRGNWQKSCLKSTTDIPISLQVTKAYSPASIGKAYLRAMGIKPILAAPAGFSQRISRVRAIGFFRWTHERAHPGKSPCRSFIPISSRCIPRSTALWTCGDSSSPTKSMLLNIVSRRSKRFLLELTAEELFKPATWKKLTAFVRIIPNGDILPSRARYKAESHDWQVAVNHLYSTNDDPKNALWFSLPDVAASVILSGRVPKIVDAFRIEPHGVSKTVKSIKLRGEINVNPRTQDFFKSRHRRT